MYLKYFLTILINIRYNEINYLIKVKIMKNTIFISTIVLSFLIFPIIILGQGKQPSEGGTQQRIQDPSTHEETSAVSSQGNQVQNQIKTQNAGEDSQLQVNTEESLQSNEDGAGSQGRSTSAKQNMSVVAEKVEELLISEGSENGIGQQIKDIANKQKQAQGEIKGQLDKLELRKGFMKKLFGADKKAIKNLKQQIEQNQLRIKKLQQLQTQVINQADQTQIQEAVQALTEQNTALTDQIQSEEQVVSLFGWLTKLFIK